MQLLQSGGTNADLPLPVDLHIGERQVRADPLSISPIKVLELQGHLVRECPHLHPTWLGRLLDSLQPLRVAPKVLEGHVPHETGPKDDPHFFRLQERLYGASEEFPQKNQFLMYSNHCDYVMTRSFSGYGSRGHIVSDSDVVKLVLGRGKLRVQLLVLLQELLYFSLSDFLSSYSILHLEFQSLDCFHFLNDLHVLTVQQQPKLIALCVF